ncbi:MAG: amidohydrolase family protein [Candidatus Thermoplasmatota archaeon]|nr:amidohydrolase family protein [Candidatus Thermoplasmatota archaeon]
MKDVERCFKGRIFDGKDIIEEGWVGIGNDGLISEVGEGKFAHSAENITEGRDLTILPGLIDAHMHFFGCRYEDIAEWNLISGELASVRSVTDMRNLLMAGFTTVRDLGSKTAVHLAQAEIEGDIIGPSVIASGHSLAQTGGNDDLKFLPLEMAKSLSYSYYCDGPWECVSAVRKVIREGATVIKVYASGGFAAGNRPLPNLTFEELKAIVDEGHRSGVKVTAHAYGEEALNNVIDAGIDSIEHGIGLTEDIAERIRKAGIYYIPTMSVYMAEKNNHGRLNLLPRIRGKSRVNRSEIISRHVTKEIEIAQDVGLKIVMGTDFVGAKNSRHGDNTIEIERLSKFLGPEKALKSSTSLAADCIGLDKAGRIRKGYSADLVVVNGNPFKDIVKISKNAVKYVIHGSRIFDIDAMRKVP